MIPIAQLQTVHLPDLPLGDGSTRAVPSPVLPKELAAVLSAPAKADIAEDFAQIFARASEQKLPSPMELSAKVQTSPDQEPENRRDMPEAVAPDPEDAFEPRPFPDKANDPMQEPERAAPDLHSTLPAVPDRKIAAADLVTWQAMKSPQDNLHRQAADAPLVLPPPHPEARAPQILTGQEPEPPIRSADKVGPGKWLALQLAQAEPTSSPRVMPQAIDPVPGKPSASVATGSAPQVSVAPPTLTEATAALSLSDHVKTVMVQGPALTVPADAQAPRTTVGDQPPSAPMMSSPWASADRSAPVAAWPAVLTVRGDSQTDRIQVMPQGAHDAPMVNPEPDTIRLELPVLQQNASLMQPATSGLVRPTLPEKPDRQVASDTALLPTGQPALARTEVLDARSEPQRPDVSRVIVQQMVDAAIRAVERPVELHLNPEELGRVRINMTIADALVTLNIMAERAETLDLMRRHSELLAQELRQLGYGTINFSFGQNGSGREGAQDAAPGHVPPSSNDPVASADSVAPPRSIETTLDIRL